MTNASVDVVDFSENIMHSDCVVYLTASSSRKSVSYNADCIASSLW